MASRLRPLVACWVSLLAPVVKAPPKKKRPADNSCRMADRLAFLPLKLTTKAALGALVLGPKAVWGGLLNGRAFLALGFRM